MKKTKKLWVAGDTCSVAIGDSGFVMIGWPECKKADNILEGSSWPKKPSKFDATGGGSYPEAWPPKRVTITAEVEE